MPTCTCPSGDGSLRWPCPTHPPEIDMPDNQNSSEWQYESMRFLAYKLRQMSAVGFDASVCTDAASWLEKMTAPAMLNGVEYDRELIAKMLEAFTWGKAADFQKPEVLEQASLLRAADNRVLPALPDDFSESKDWIAGNYAERVEWLMAMVKSYRLRLQEVDNRDAAGVDSEEDAYVIERMGKMLAEIAVIVNGPEPAGTKWSYHDLPEKVRALAAQPAAGEAVAPDEVSAEAMGAKGAPPSEAERIAFEAWMRGHCWHLSATWDGSHYRSDAEQGGNVCPNALRTRMLWAAWRDRAALSAPAAVPAGEAVAFNRDSILRSARLRAACYAMVNLIEGPGCIRWADPAGSRLKDTDEWVKFYVATKNVQNNADTHPPAAEAPAPVQAAPQEGERAGEGKGISASHKKHDGPCWRNSHADCGC